jgi:Ca2+-dependent lipid-binding protein
VEVVSGKLIEDTDTWGKMDPFVILKYKDELFQTETDGGGGKNPKWGELFEIHI